MSETIKSKQETKHNNRSWMFLGLFAALSFWVANWVYAYTETDLDNRGTFGDAFGIVNSVFSGMAFLGVIIALFLQRDELSIAKAERQDTRTILDEQQQNIEAQNKATIKQSFESTAFQLIKNINEKSEQKANSISDFVSYFKNNKKNLKRQYILAHLDEETRGKINEYDATASWNPKRGEDILSRLMHEARPPEFDSQVLMYWYNRKYKERAEEFSDFFRSLYTTLKFVAESNVSEEDKIFYIKFIRAQLTNSEANILALNYLSDFSTSQFNEIINKYGLLKNASRHVEPISTLINIIPASAFGRGYSSQLLRNSEVHPVPGP